MTLSSKIALSFTVNNGTFRLVTSSENSSGLDDTIAAKAGGCLQQIAKAFQAYDLSKCASISVTLTPSGKDYYMSFEGIPELATQTIKLNAAFVKALAGVKPTLPATLPPPSSTTVHADNQTKPLVTLPPTQTSDLNDWVMVPSTSPGPKGGAPDDKAKHSEAQPALKSPAPKTVGIQNNTTGVDCFINAIMQVIMHNELLRTTLIATYEHDDSAEAQAFMAAINLYAAGEEITTTALRAFMPSKFRNGQQDASEFLLSLLNRVDQRNFPNLYPTVKTSYKWERKEGFFFPTVVETVNTSVESPELVIPLHIPTQVKTIINGEALIKGHFSKRKHAGENYKDEKTGRVFSPGEVQVSIENSPPQLVFSLNRFTRSGKIHSAIQMPESVTIASAKYVLKEIVMHHGVSMSKGHYTSLLRDETGGWTHADDIRVKPHSKRGDLTDGYLYFYERL